MTDDDRFFVWIGRGMALFGLVVVVTLTVYSLTQLRQADLDSDKPTFTVAPDSTPRKTKP